MAFIYEIVPEKDYGFFKSMRLKNERNSFNFEFKPGSTGWSADRKQNAYLVRISGGHGEIPLFYDLWWNGDIIRMEVSSGGSGDYYCGYKHKWFIENLPIPKKLWNKKDDIISLINEAFSVDYGWKDPDHVISIEVVFEREPKIKED